MNFTTIWPLLVSSTYTFSLLLIQPKSVTIIKTKVTLHKNATKYVISLKSSSGLGPYDVLCRMVKLD